MTFEEFTKAEMAGLARFSGALIPDRHLAEDMLSDALLKAAHRWRRISRMENPAAYVRRVIVTTYLSETRKALRRRTVPSDDQDQLDSPAPDGTAAVIAKDEVIRLLDQLPPQQRTAIVMRYLLDAPDEQIAYALGCQPATVRSHLSRARQALRLTAHSASIQERQ